MCATTTGMIYTDIRTFVTSCTYEYGNLQQGDGENKNRRASLLNLLPHI